MNKGSREQFSERLKAAMDARGIRQVDLADLIESTPASVNRWVNGKAIPEGAGASHLAARLGVTVAWLLRGEETDITRRNPLRVAREGAGMTVRDLAKATGYEIGVLQAVENGARASEKMIEAICVAIPNASKEDFMSGSEHPSIISEDSHEGTYGSKPQIQLPPGTKARFVPLLSWAQAGALGAGHTDDGYDQTGVLAYDINDRKAFALEIRGDSMSPQINEGDRVVVCPSWTPHNGDTVIARTVDGDIYCKLLQRSAGDKFVLVSVNSAHPNIEIPREEVAWIYPIGQVTKNLRRE